MTDPADSIAVTRFEWERMIRRAPLHPMTKLIAYTLAQYGSRDGTGIHPGLDKLTNVCRVDEKTIRRHLTILRTEGLLFRIQEEDWRRRARLKIADEYELRVPTDYADRLDVLDPKERPR